MEERSVRDAQSAGTDGERLGDLAGVSLDPGIPREKREAYVLGALGDPCRFRVGGICVRLAFSEEGPCLQDALFGLLRRKKGGL